MLPLTVPVPLWGALAPAAPLDDGFVAVVLVGADLIFVSVFTAVPAAGLAD